MYTLYKIRQSIRIPPNKFGGNLEDAALGILQSQYERTVDKDVGVIVSMQNPKIVSKGKIVPGDGAAYFTVECDVLAFNCEVNEVLEGVVSQVVEFGAFVRIGPIDGLVHVSQITNEFMSFDAKTQKLSSKNGKYSLAKDDAVKAKVSTVSLKDSIPSSKIALTMRPDGLGKLGQEKKAGKEDKAEKVEKKKKKE